MMTSPTMLCIAACETSMPLQR